MKLIRPDFRLSVTSSRLLSLAAVALLATGCASVNKALNDVDVMTGKAKAVAAHAEQAKKDAKQATDDIKKIVPGKGFPSIPSTSTQKPGQSTDSPAGDEPIEEPDNGEGEDPAETPDAGSDSAPPPSAPVPPVKARLAIEAESPLECTEGEQVELICHAATPTGVPVAGVIVVFHVTDSASSRDIGTAKTGSDGIARHLYRPSFNFRGRRSSVVLKYVARVEGSRRWYATSDAGQITFLRADSGQ